jgi:REP element-mobilizing transposase RayT
LIFSTKSRTPFLDDDIRPRVHAYLATAIRNMDSPFVVVGGVADHVHILFDMGKMHAPIEFVEQVKRESSTFVKTLGRRYDKFYWQRGYGMLSVSPTHLVDAENYVRNQPEHHRKKTFQEEFREFLKRYGIEYDERYVRDGNRGGVNMAFGQNRSRRPPGPGALPQGYGEIWPSAKGLSRPARTPILSRLGVSGLKNCANPQH